MTGGALIPFITVAATLSASRRLPRALGHWEATRPDGRGLAFNVVRFAFATAARDVTAHCPDRFSGVLTRT